MIRFNQNCDDMIGVKLKDITGTELQELFVVTNYEQQGGIIVGKPIGKLPGYLSSRNLLILILG